MRVLRPGVMRTDLIRVQAKITAAAPVLVGHLAEQTAEKARELLSRNSHPYGTPTPAHRGGPPAMISGTLHDSVAASAPRPTGVGTWVARVGIIAGRTPWYSKTPAATYGAILDRGDFPWLTAAYRDVARTGAAAAFRRAKGFISAA